MKYDEIVKKIESLKSRVAWKKKDLEEAEFELEMAEDYLASKIYGKQVVKEDGN